MSELHVTSSFSSLQFNNNKMNLSSYFRAKNSSDTSTVQSKSSDVFASLVFFFWCDVVLFRYLLVIDRHRSHCSRFTGLKWCTNNLYLLLFFAIVIVRLWCVPCSKYSKFTFATGSAHLLLSYKVEQFSLPLITKFYYFKRLRSRIVCYRIRQLLLRSWNLRRKPLLIKLRSVILISFTMDLRITICNQAVWNDLTNMPILRPDILL